MRRFLTPLVTAAVLAVAVATSPSLAAAGNGAGHLGGQGMASAQEPARAEQGDVVPVALWTFLSVVGAGLAGGVLYLFKRRIGAFPRNPAWVAPITIMRSADAPDEGAFGEAAAVSHGSHH